MLTTLISMWSFFAVRQYTIIFGFQAFPGYTLRCYRLWFQCEVYLPSGSIKISFVFWHLDTRRFQDTLYEQWQFVSVYQANTEWLTNPIASPVKPATAATVIFDGCHTHHSAGGSGSTGRSSSGGRGSGNDSLLPRPAGRYTCGRFEGNPPPAERWPTREGPGRVREYSETVVTRAIIRAVCWPEENWLLISSYFIDILKKTILDEIIQLY